jgi:hypothetical protein
MHVEADAANGVDGRVKENGVAACLEKRHQSLLHRCAGAARTQTGVHV